MVENTVSMLTDEENIPFQGERIFIYNKINLGVQDTLIKSF